MTILENFDLTSFNTFGVKVRAKFFIEISNGKEVLEVFESDVFRKNKHLFLGGGSNVLFTEDFNGLVILNKLEGIKIIKDKEDHVLIRALSGVVWHDLVLFAVERGYWGIENLSLIPGTVGGAPVQNIGAYGAELKDVFEYVEAYDTDTLKKVILKKEDCGFGYRDSVFKNSAKDKYFILSLVLRLSKSERKNLNYKVLKEYLEKNKIEVNNSKDVSDAVASIRREKLPDPKVIGNAGSFFKNIFVPKVKLEELLVLFPDLPHFEEGGVQKIPTAWLIERCGWKGRRVGNVGVHDKQALVLVNHGGGTGEELKNLSEQIKKDVFSKFGLEILPEVNLI